MNDNNLNLNKAIDIFFNSVLEYFTSSNTTNIKIIKNRHCTMPINLGNKKIICDKIIINKDNFFCDLHVKIQEEIKNQPSIVKEKKIQLPTKIGDDKYFIKIGEKKYII